MKCVILSTEELMYDYTKIKNYILWLRKNRRISVSLHSAGNESLFSEPELSAFNVHDNPYCAYLKGSKCAAADCVKKQAAAQEKSASGAYTGMCRAGVFEFVYPINSPDKTVGFISVSGYRAPGGEERVKRTAAHYGLSYGVMGEKYALLKEPPADKPEIDALIFPLSDMLTLALIFGEKKRMTAAERTCEYINKNCGGEITSRDICKALGISRSYMSREFNREMHVTVREYINSVRIKNAKVLLESSALNVSEVAYSVGFSDSGYFSSVFKKATGLSPLEYKKGKLHIE